MPQNIQHQNESYTAQNHTRRPEAICLQNLRKRIHSEWIAEIAHGELNHGTFSYNWKKNSKSLNAILTIWILNSWFTPVNGHTNAKSADKDSHKASLWFSICDGVSWNRIRFYKEFLIMNSKTNWRWWYKYFASIHLDTGEKPFPCDYCGIRFRQKDCLKRHIIAKHAPDRVKHFVCEVCGKNLLCKYSLKMHLSRHGAHEIAAAGKKRGKS